jgi:hypothetical protein
MYSKKHDLNTIIYIKLRLFYYNMTWKKPQIIYF